MREPRPVSCRLRFLPGGQRLLLLQDLLHRLIARFRLEIALYDPLGTHRDARFLQTGPDARFLVCIGDGDILRQREGEHAEILKYHGEELPISGIVIFADIDAV